MDLELIACINCLSPYHLLCPRTLLRSLRTFMWPYLCIAEPTCCPGTLDMSAPLALDKQHITSSYSRHLVCVFLTFQCRLTNTCVVLL